MSNEFLFMIEKDYKRKKNEKKAYVKPSWSTTVPQLFQSDWNPTV